MNAFTKSTGSGKTIVLVLRSGEISHVGVAHGAVLEEELAKLCRICELAGVRRIERAGLLFKAPIEHTVTQRERFA